MQSVPFRLILICDADVAARAGHTLDAATSSVLDALPDDAPLAFMVRDKSARSDDEIAAWAAPLVDKCNHMGGPRVIVHTRTTLAARIGAHGVHFADTERPRAETNNRVVGQSVHEPATFRGAADYEILAPIFAPTSKRAAALPLGLATLKARARATAAPLFALGGITVENAPACCAHGAYGVAVLGAWLFADDTAAYARRLVASVTGSPRPL